MAEKAVQTEELSQKSCFRQKRPIFSPAGVQKHSCVRHVRVTCTAPHGTQNQNIASNLSETPTTQDNFSQNSTTRIVPKKGKTEVLL